MAFSTPEKQSEYNRKYYAENRDRMREGMQKWRENNGDRHRAKSREYHHKNRDAILPQKRARWQANADEINERRREKKFKLPPGAYKAMVAAQNGCCAICGEKRRLVVDHNHRTDVVRSLLCSPCNTAIGLLKEDTLLMWRAIEYVLEHNRAAKRAAMIKARAVEAKQAPGGVAG